MEYVLVMPTQLCTRSTRQRAATHCATASGAHGNEHWFILILVGMNPKWTQWHSHRWEPNTRCDFCCGIGGVCPSSVGHNSRSKITYSSEGQRTHHGSRWTVGDRNMWQPIGNDPTFRPLSCPSGQPTWWLCCTSNVNSWTYWNDLRRQSHGKICATVG